MSDPATLHPTDNGQRYGAFHVAEVLRESGDWLLAKCRHENGTLAMVKAVTTSAARAHDTLRREAELLSMLAEPGHPGVVKLLEHELGARPWYAMEWIDGWSLARERTGAPLPLERIARIGSAVAEALDYIHAHGIVHGDVSPSNVLVDAAGNATLIDFGSAALAFEPAATREIGHAGDARYGTPGYVAPERLSLGVFDARSDLYSLGCILCELSTGKPATEAPKTLRASPLADLIRALIRKDPAQRCNTAAEVRNLLAAYEPGGTAPSSGARARRTFPLHKSPLVGRTSALGALMAGIDRACSGSPELVLVGGESGIGKTSLLNEAARIAKQRGFEVLFGRCHDLLASGSANSSAGRALGPFLPLLIWANDTLHERSEDGRARLQDALGILADYDSRLREARASAAPAALPPTLARARVLRSLATILTLVTAEKPLLMIVDDVQWADDLSIAFLSSELTLTVDRAKLCLVAAYRSDELAKDVEQQLSARATGAVVLERLSVDDVAVLAGSLLGSQLVPAQVSELLHRHSDGNPFLVVQYLYSLLHQGVLRQSADDARAFQLDLADQRVSVPAGLKELFEIRIAGLTPGARRVLQLGAVLGGEFRGDVLKRSAERAEHGLNAALALSELVEQRLLEAMPDARYRFVHDKLREAQLGALAPEARSALHHEAAELLSSDASLSTNDTELGLHFAEAARPARALPHLEAAADQAAQRHANAEAIDLYALALRQLRALDEPADGERDARELRLAEARGDVLFRSGRNEEALAQYSGALDSADRATRVRLKRKQAAAAWTAHDYEAATAALDAAEEALAYAAEGDTPERTHSWIEIQQGRFWLHYFARQAGPLTETVVNHMRPVVERYGTELQRSMFFECAACDVMARHRYSFSAEVVALARRGLAELRGGVDHTGQAGSARFVLALSLVIGNEETCREAAELLEQNIKELEPIGDATLLSRSLVYQSMAHRRLGRANEARLTSRRARRYAERAQLTPYIGASLACEAWLSWRSERLSDAEQLASEASNWWRKGAHVFPFRWLASFVSLDIHRMRDDFSAAAIALDDLLEPTQMCFGEPLSTALIVARDACTSRGPREASRQLDAVLRLAHADGYL
jgi:hypothetical protein